MTVLLRWFGCLGILLSVLGTQSARACGLTPPIGPNGLATVCRGDDAEALIRAGLNVGATSTRIEFGAISAKLVQAASVVTVDVYPIERLALTASFGGSIAGKLDYAGERYELLPGPIGGLGLSYRFLGGELPFVHASLAVSMARSTSRDPRGDEASFTSRDYRLGLAIGGAVASWIAPFAVGRYFGAGTDWKVAGGKGADAFRYHVGGGAAFRIFQDADVLVEIAPFGERRASVGGGYVF